MTTVVISGWNSTIAIAFRQMMPKTELAVRAERSGSNIPYRPGEETRYLLCAGMIVGKGAAEQTEEEKAATYQVNFEGPTDWCDWIFKVDPTARVCVIGSESAYRGSFDETYADAKRLLHEYVESKMLSPDQQLVAISPGLIEDSGMYRRRHDFGAPELDARKAAHPKGRFLEAAEVAALARFLLIHDRGYITNTVIRMHGGLV